jgi:hypothetical protein
MTDASINFDAALPAFQRAYDAWASAGEEREDEDDAPDDERAEAEAADRDDSHSSAARVAGAEED